MAHEPKTGPSPYVVVLYENNTCGVIPLKWMFKDSGKLFCYWSGSRKRVVDLVDANPNWPVSAITKVFGRRGK